MSDLRERLQARVQVDPETACWNWQGNINPATGYGRVFVGSKRDGTNRMAAAHRVSYEAFVGPIPEGLTLDHLCRNRWCVNPEHLEPVTVGENVLRGVGASAQNARKTHCPKGHEYTPDNTRIYKRGRICRTCNNAHSRRYGAQMRATNPERVRELSRERTRRYRARKRAAA